MVPKYGKLKEQLANPKKVYVIDTGSINEVSFKFSQNIGRSYGNIVLIHFKRRDDDVYYLKNKYECDFLTTKGEDIEGVKRWCISRCGNGYWDDV